MITFSEKIKLYEYFSYILFFGFKHDYSFDFMERHLSSSSIVKTIEKKNDCNFLYDSTLSDSIKEIYGLVQLFDDDIVAQSVYSLWISEAYLKLLFEYRKPLSYLFLYIPLEEMVRIFSPYHEMDWTHLYAEFERRVEQTSLLRAILDKENISINKLSQLTGISKNTLTTYLVDERLRAASFENIYKIANVLELDIDIFAEHINAYNEGEISDNLIKNNDLLSTIALYMVSYYSSDISNRKYVYDKEENISINKLSQLTGISKNTLTTYLVDERLRAASFENIYKIANVLELDIDIFAEHINAYNEGEISDNLSKNNDLLSTIALYMVSYYSSDISNRKYVYDKEENIYKYKDLRLKVLFTSNNKEAKEVDSINLEADRLIEEYSKHIKKEERKNYVIIINESNQISNSLSPYKKWLNFGFERIFILNSENIICIKEDYWKSNVSISVVENIKNRVIS